MLGGSSAKLAAAPVTAGAEPPPDVVAELRHRYDELTH